MLKQFLLLALILTVGATAAWGGGAFGKLPMSFEPNLGQTDPEVKFLARGPGYTLFLTADGSVLSLRGSSPLRISLAGANIAAAIEAAEPLGGKSNYFIGNDPSKWVTDVPQYGSVRRTGVWSGVDMVYYGSQGRLEYDFRVAPGADPGQVRLRLAGHTGLRVDRNGDLAIQLLGGEVRQLEAVIYQEQDGGRRSPVRGRYVLRGGDEVALRVEKYDRSRPLVMDPVLVYSTYLGGSGFDSVNAIAVDAAGSAYVAGETQSGDFPKVTPVQGTIAGGSDAFVAKLNPAGTALVYSTFLGGSGDDKAYGVAVDSAGNAYVGGYSISANYPLQNPLFSTGQNGFVTKLNAAGNALVYSTRFTTTSFPNNTVDSIGVRGIAVDSSGAAYITGYAGAGLTVLNARQSSLGGGSFDEDAFLAKINPQGSALVFSTYVGGTGKDQGSAVTVDSSGNAWIAGNTASTNFPTMAPRQGGLSAGIDGFVAKFSGTGQLLFSTLLGGAGDDYATAIAVDSTGNAFVTGYTSSTDFPLSSAYQSTLAGGNNIDAFVTGYSPSGNAYLFSTYLGGGANDYGYGISASHDGSVVIAGETDFGGTTAPPAFPVLSPIQAVSGSTDWTGPDAFVARFSAAGTLLFSSFLGGNNLDSARGVAVDQAGAIYVAGQTASTGFPATPNGLQPTKTGNTDGFVTKIDLTSTCSFAVSSGLGNFTSAGGSGSFTVTTTPGCFWFASPSAAWIAITSGASGVGNGTVNYSVAANTGSSQLLGTIVVPSGGFPIRQDGANSVCPALPLAVGQTLNGTLADAGCGVSTGGSRPGVEYYITATAGQNLAIGANSNAVYPVIALYGPDGTLLGTDSHGPSCSGYPFCTCTNPDPPARVPGGPFSTTFLSVPVTGVYIVEISATGNSNCADYTGTFTLTASNAIFTLAASSATAPASGTTGSVSFTASSPQGNWYATSDSPWLVITSALSGTGGGSVSYTAEANTTSTQRSGVITIGGQVFTVAQDGGASCIATLAPPSAGVAASGGGGSVSVTAPGLCAWTAVPGVPWITVTGGSGLGNGHFTYTAAAYAFASPRQGVVTVNAAPFTLTQAGVTASYSLVATSANAAAGGGTGTVGVIATPSDAPWTATTNAPFLTITSGPSGAGSGTVGYSVGSNTTGHSRQGTLTIAGMTFTVTQVGATAGMGFFPVTPCRVADTRNGTGPFGAPSMAARDTRSFPIPQSACGIPANAQAYSLNVTVVPRGRLSYLTLWPTDQPRPLVSTLNSFEGTIVANAALVPAGTAGAVSVYVTDATDVILDINGYFAGADVDSYAFYPVSPCRVADTRGSAGPFGAPSIAADGSRDFAVPSAGCGIPATAHAYSLNATVVPQGPLSYLTMWPTGGPQPLVSTLNSFEGAIVANAAIVPAGSSGAISAFATNRTDLIIDANGYFAP